MQESYIRNLKEERTTHIARMREVLDRAQREKRGLEGDERQTVERIESKIGDLDEQIRSFEDRVANERDAEAARAPYAHVVRGTASSHSNTEDTFRSFLRGEIRAIEVPGLDRVVKRDGSVEVRDLLKGAAATGGDTVPTSFRNVLHEHLIETSAIYRLNVTILNTASGENMDLPKTASYGTAAIVGEGTALAESDPSFAKVTVGTYKYSQLLQASSELVQDSGVDMTGFIARQAALALSNGYGNAFMYGSGTNQPQGVFVGASVGGTAQTGSTGVPSFNDIWDLVYSVSSPYRTSRSQFLTKDSNVAALRKIKSTTGEYIWQPAISPAQTDQLFGYQIVTDPNVSAWGTAAGTPIAFGSFDSYVLRQTPTRFERSDDYAFANDLITWRVIQRLDGRMLDTLGVRTMKSPTT